MNVLQRDTPKTYVQQSGFWTSQVCKNECLAKGHPQNWQQTCSCRSAQFWSEVKRAIVDVSLTHTPVAFLLHVKQESESNRDKTWQLYPEYPLKTVKDSKQQESL